MLSISPSPPAEVVCPACGYGNRASFRACHNCGAALLPAEKVQPGGVHLPGGMTCPTCRVPIPAGRRFCDQCGTPMIPASPPGPEPFRERPVCPSCGMSNRTEARHCGRCGLALTGVLHGQAGPEPVALHRSSAGQSPPVAPAEHQPRSSEKEVGGSRGSRTVAIITAAFGCLLVVGGGFGLLSNDPRALICWLPGLILVILGLVLNRRTKAKQGRKR